jgi:hypothetical protein
VVHDVVDRAAGEGEDAAEGCLRAVTHERLGGRQVDVAAEG